MDDKNFKQVATPAGYVSVAPLPSADELAKFYAELYYQTPQTTTYHASYPEHELAHKRLRADLLLHAIQTVQPRTSAQATLLEVGAGEGFVLKAAADSGYTIRGIDFSDFGLRKFHPDLADRLETGDAFQILDQVIDRGDQIDVCILQNVLEHVIDPVALIARIRKLIGKHGVAGICVPNDFSRLQQVATELGFIDRQYWMSPPQHLHYFNTDNLRTFLQQNGLDVVDAFADFPIEMFLFHPGSNYTRTPSAGRDAHQARVRLDLMLAEKGLTPYHQLCRAMTNVGFGRNVTMLVRGA